MTEKTSRDLPAAIADALNRMPDAAKKNLDIKKIYEEATKMVQTYTVTKDAANTNAWDRDDQDATQKAAHAAAVAAGRESNAVEYAKLRGGRITAMPSLKEMDEMRRHEAAIDKAVQEVNLTISYSGLASVSDQLNPNSRGDVTIPGQAMVINVSKLNDGLAKQKIRDTHD